MYYVYRHIRLDKNEPFYIGIGSSPYYKRAKTTLGRNPIWNNIVSKTDFCVDILFETESLDFAKCKEIEFISLYGRIANSEGTLANLTGGGDGMFDPSKSIRERMSKAMLGAGNHFYGKKHSAETRKKISENQAGKKRGSLPLETRKKIGVANKGKGGKLKAGLKDHKGALSRSGVKHHSYIGDVFCFDSNGLFIRSFSTIGEAAAAYKTNCNSIRRVIVKERNHFNGLIFSYSQETPKPIKIIDNSSKQVINTKTGEIYSTIQAAAFSIGMNYKTFSHKVKGERKNETDFILLKNHQIINGNIH